MRGEDLGHNYTFPISSHQSGVPPGAGGYFVISQLHSYLLEYLTPLVLELITTTLLYLRYLRCSGSVIGHRAIIGTSTPLLASSLGL